MTMQRARVLATTAAVAALLAVIGFQPSVAEPSNSYLVVWAGDWNGGDLSSKDAVAMSPSTAERLATSAAPGPDFLAIVDADPASARYGDVVATVPVPGVENEPHHMQYSWKPGQRIFAGGLFSDRTFVFDVDDIPNVSLAGVVEPIDTPCGSVPDAYWVLNDGRAYGTYMGGPNVAGDPRCNDGINNGFAGTPGTIALIRPDATIAREFSAAGDPASPHPNDVRASCASNPPLARPSCANPHGVQAREDLDPPVLVVSDYAEPRNVPTDPAPPTTSDVFRDTVRVFDISDRENPTLRSVSVLPKGSMSRVPPQMLDPRGLMGIMETTVTNLPQHRGAFASSMCGGQIYYTADITAPAPMWRQVFDATAAAQKVAETDEQIGGCVGAGWLQTSPDDTVLFQAVIGRNPGSLNSNDPGVSKMVYALDIRSLVAMPPSQWTESNPDVCSINESFEIFNGGAEPTCPSVLDAIELPDATSGGPHWGAIDNFSLSADTDRVTSVTRIAASSYFVARAGIDGDHALCMISVGSDGDLSLDQAFQDGSTGEPCVGFDRPMWPHGPFGAAKPHSMLFVSPS